MVRVTNLENGRTVVLKINDRGPFVGDRLIDISRRGARDLGLWKRDGPCSRGVVKERELLLKQQTLAATRGGGRLCPLHRGMLLTRMLCHQRRLPVLGPRSHKRYLPTERESWVQVGAFSSRENAEAFYNKVSSLHRGHISLSPPGGDPYSGCVLGRFRP